MDLKDLSLQPTRVSDQVKQVLKQSILEGKLGSGDKLPTEAQIAAQLKVSKATVREALRHMEAEGLIRKRRGAFGGNFASMPGARIIGNTIKNSYAFGGVTFEELLDLRRMLEPVFISVAAKRRTVEDLEKMASLTDAHDASLNAGKRDVEKSIDFHRLIANACHNILVSAIIEGLMGAYQTVLGAMDIDLEDERLDLEFNKKFYQAILELDAVRARELMVEHFNIFKAPVKGLTAQLREAGAAADSPGKRETLGDGSSPPRSLARKKNGRLPIR